MEASSVLSEAESGLLVDALSELRKAMRMAPPKPANTQSLEHRELKEDAYMNNFLGAGSQVRNVPRQYGKDGGTTHGLPICTESQTRQMTMLRPIRCLWNMDSRAHALVSGYMDTLSF